MRRPGFLAVLAAGLFASLAPAQPTTRADLKPGLIFTAAAADGGSYSRIEPGVALSLGAGESPHPRMSAGDTFTWAGYLNVIIPGKYKFDAVLLGKLTATVGGKTVVAGEATGTDPAAAKRIDGPELDLPAGFQPVAVTLTRTGPAARVELIWKGPGFQAEPVPYFFFGHRPKDRPAGAAADLARDHGRFLFEELSCARCHRPDAADAMAKTLVDRTSPDLTDIGKRANPGWIAAWLADPHKLRPNTAMPKLFADGAAGDAERYAVTAYLASLGGPPPEERRDLGRRIINERAANGKKLYLTAGCAACHGDQVNAAPTAKKLADDEDEDEKPAAKPEDLLYGAGSADPRGYYRLGAVGSKFTAPALARFLRNPLATNPHGRMPNMLLTDREAEDIAEFLCQSTDSDLSRGMPKEPDITKEQMVKMADDVTAYIAGQKFENLSRPDLWKLIGRGQSYRKGCTSCHSMEENGKQRGANQSAPLLGTMAKIDLKGGCLSDAPAAGKVPAYSLTADQRSALRAFLAVGMAGPGSPAPAFQARLAMKRFNCLNCHNRDGEGGITEAIADQMKALEKAENADDVQPPRLTAAGHKLRTPWLRQVLTGAGRARPWLGLRMPQYGEANVGFLPNALPKLEGTVPDDAAAKIAITPEKLEGGRALTGKTTSGFGCIACHDIAGIPAGGTRGPDLATVNNRVRYDWYVRWMHQPQRLAPGTKMPQNFLDGRSQIAGVLKGDADAQIEALWAYLALGPTLPLPEGIEPPNKALAVPVKNRAEVLRTFMPDGAGTRAIAVGYPGGFNLAFDPLACRTAYAWGGNFLDAGPAWNDRGGAPAKLLGAKFWTAPAGHPWAVTDSRTPPDFAERESDPAYGHQLKDDAFYGGPRRVHFAGYSLDEKGNPTFRYALDGPDGKPALTVMESFTPLPIKIAAGFARTFAVEAKPNQTPWLRAATAAKGARVYAADGKAAPLAEEVAAAGVRVAVPQPNGGAVVLQLAAGPPGAAWVAAGRDVLLRLPDGATGDAVLHVWGLSQDDEQLLKGLTR